MTQVLQFVQLVQPVDDGVAEVVVLWLLLMEALCAPHVLWVLSRRYRHALVYVWTVHVLRDASAKEEDPSACTLQSYMRRVQTTDGATVRVIARTRRGVDMSTPVQEHPSNGNIGGRLREASPNHFTDGGMYDLGRPTRPHLEIITTDLDDDLTVITDLASRKARYIYHSPASEAAASLRGDDSQAERAQQHAEGSDSSWKGSEPATPSRKGSEPISPSRLSVGSPAHGFDVPRTGSSRQMWKEQMRRKHLPAVFVNEAFDAEEGADHRSLSNDLRGLGLARQVDVQALPDVAQIADDDNFEDVESASDGDGAAANVMKTSDERGFPYLASSRFPHHHHNYLRSDSLSRMGYVLESESDGSSFQYDDKDIEVILDREQHSLQSASRRSVLESVIETEGSGEAMNFPELLVARGMESGLECSPLGREDSNVSSNDSSEGSIGETQWTRGHGAVRKPPRQSLVNVRSSKPSSLHHQQHLQPAFGNENGLADKNKATFSEAPPENEEPKSLVWDFKGLQRNADVPDRDWDSSEEMRGSERLANLVQKEQVDHCYPGQPDDSFRTKSPEEGGLDGSAFASVNGHGNDETVQNDSCDKTLGSDVKSSPLTSSVTAAGTSGVFVTTGRGGIADVDFDDVKPQNPRTRTAVLDDDFDEVDQPQGSVGTPPVSASQTSSRVAGNTSGVSTGTPHGVSQLEVVKNNNWYNSRRRASDFNFPYDDDFGEPMITMVNDDANLPETAIVLDVLETSSTGSEHSIVLEPYRENRRPPWMDRAYSDDDELTPRSLDFSAANLFPMSSFKTPFQDKNRQKDIGIKSLGGSLGTSGVRGRDSYDMVSASRKDSLRTDSSSGFYRQDSFSSESGSDTLQSSGSSDQLHFLSNVTPALSAPVIFEEVKDRRFENALAVNYNICAPSYYGGYPGLYFESIKEEPEDVSDSTVSDDRDDARPTFKKDNTLSSAAGSASPGGSNPLPGSGVSTFKTRSVLSRSSSGQSDENISDRLVHTRTSADGKEASNKESCSPQTTENFKPEDQIVYVNDTAVTMTSVDPVYF